MPMIFKGPKTTINKTEANHFAMAVQPVGNRSARTLPNGTQLVKIHGGRCRLFYKMDQSQTPGYDNIEQHPKIRMEIYYMQVKRHLILIPFIPNANTLHDRFGLPATLISDNGNNSTAITS